MSRISQGSGLTRREWLKLAAAGVLGPSMSGWLPALAQQTQAQRPRKSCILLWMDGGPSQQETFDLKPDAPAEIRGAFRPIATSAPGIEISEALPRVARIMHHAAVLRGMSTPDGNHLTARVHMHTGFRQGGGVDYPTLGSLVSAELGDRQAVMPNFVVTGIPTYDSVRFPLITSPGYLGPVHAPLVVNDLRRGVENLRGHISEDDFQDRLSILQEMQRSFAQGSQSSAAEAQRTTTQRALRLMRSPAVSAFDLDREAAPTRSAYGDSYFGQGCLLARRLVEVGVPFVEVYLPDWDTHFQTRVTKNWNQSMPQLDVGLSALIHDLDMRGMLDSTLVVWMGEFGRTPRVNNRAGRDHYARAWSTVLFGGGIRAGQVIGRTDAQGANVVDGRVGVADFFATVCRILGIDPAKEVTVRDRPLRLVDRDARPVRELF
jgi:uncharacterized protein (DUF1501 family)